MGKMDLMVSFKIRALQIVLAEGGLEAPVVVQRILLIHGAPLSC
jgi:hypothetical protein